MLQFFGRGSAFEKEQNSAFFVDQGDLVLFDCPMSAFHRLKAIGPDKLTYPHKTETIYVLVTHTHCDHTGGLPMLIHYAFYVWHLPVVVAAPSSEVRDDLEYLIGRLDGCNPASYTLTTANTLDRWKVAAIPTSHSPSLSGRCFGYSLLAGDRPLVYTGDTCTLEPFLPYLEPGVTLYTEAAATFSPVHLYIHDRLPLLSELAAKGITVFLMHLDDEAQIQNAIDGTSLTLAPLYSELTGGTDSQPASLRHETTDSPQDQTASNCNETTARNGIRPASIFNESTGGFTMPNTAEKMLSDIFSVSEQLYQDMNHASENDHSKIFEHLTTLGRVLAEADRASFWKWDKNNHTLWTTAATGTDRITIPDNTGLVGKALSEGRVVVTNDPYNDPNFNPAVDKKTGYVTRSVLVMPVSNVKGEYIGAYQVINKLGNDGKFDEQEDIKKLSLAAMICGLALESDVFLEQSHTDKLTGLRNRMGFFSDFEKRYKAVIEAPDRILSLFICDIDKFKAVNDTYGHNAGDEVLKHVAEVLTSCCREGDGIYRWGGEEFIMIMPDADISTCADKAEEMRTKIEASVCVTGEYTIRHTMSFGVTAFNPEKTIEKNISIADAKLYQAKETGRNRVVF